MPLRVLLLLLSSMHLPRAEREPSELSPGRMLLHIHGAEGERARERVERKGERDRQGESETREFFFFYASTNKKSS